MSKHLSKREVRLKDEQWEELEKLQDEIAIQSRNEILRRAVTYYLEEQGWRQ